jgi:hypothetical protein
MREKKNAYRIGRQACKADNLSRICGPFVQKFESFGVS